jgi:hypothetical protein
MWYDAAQLLQAERQVWQLCGRDITVVDLVHVQRPPLLVELALQQPIVDAVLNDEVFQSAYVSQLEGRQDLVVRDNLHPREGAHRELLELADVLLAELQELCWLLCASSRR